MISMIPALTGTWPMMVDVDVQLACDADDLPPGGEQIAGQIEQWVQSTLDFPGVDWHRGLPWSFPEPVRRAAQLTVRIVGDEEGTALNREYRGGDGATNVLSFPFDEPFMLQPPLLGDIVICAPLLVTQARQQDKSLQSHWAHLVVHGVLHLLGYDHTDDRQARVMETLETGILAKLGFADPYH
jgi:probable rRNA maturation factor